MVFHEQALTSQRLFSTDHCEGGKAGDLACASGHSVLEEYGMFKVEKKVN